MPEIKDASCEICGEQAVGAVIIDGEHVPMCEKHFDEW